MNPSTSEYPFEIQQIHPVYLSENIAMQRIEQLKSTLCSILDQPDE